MKPLIDGDILLHEVGWSGEFPSEDTGENIILDVEHVEEILHKKIKLICEEVHATEPPLIFLTSNESVVRNENRRRKLRGVDPCEYTLGFRYDVAKTKPYKGTRNNPKPFHFNNLIALIMGEYDTHIAMDGHEADDLMSIYQFSYWSNGEIDKTIICSRDKDLRMCPGWHYSWECGQQRAIGPIYTDELGWLKEIITEKFDPQTQKTTTTSKVVGYGLSFFYYQMLVGDAVDNIPGLKGVGPKKAIPIIQGCNSHQELFESVKSLYINVVGLCLAKDYFIEQANLLWIRRKHDEPYKIPTFGVTKPQ